MYSTYPYIDGVRYAVYVKEFWVSLQCAQIPYVRPEYIISNYGRLYNPLNNHMYPPNQFEENKYIYPYLQTINGEVYKLGLHRIMLERFNPVQNMDSLIPNHIDGIKCHNWIWNLEWVTASGNMRHAFDTGLVKIGEERKNSIISNETARDVCQLIQDGCSNTEIHNKTGVSTQIIRNIKGGLSWKHISKDYNFSNKYLRRRLSIDDVKTIAAYLEKYGINSSAEELLYQIGIDYQSLTKKDKAKYSSCITSIRKRKFFKDILKDYNF